MSNAPKSARSFEKITEADLGQLSGVAMRALDRTFVRRPEMGAIYKNKLIAICLCQGAAQHFLRGDKGIHDFDLWAFYELTNGVRFWNRAPSKEDFGHSKFGRSPLDLKKYVGRRVDVLWRAIPYQIELDPLGAVRRYFAEGNTVSARELRKVPVVTVWPEAHRGEILWEPN